MYVCVCGQAYSYGDICLHTGLVGTVGTVGKFLGPHKKKLVSHPKKINYSPSFYSQLKVTPL